MECMEKKKKIALMLLNHERSKKKKRVDRTRFALKNFSLRLRIRIILGKSEFFRTNKIKEII